MPNYNTTPSTGGVGMDNEIGGVVVGLLEKKRSPSRGGVITGVGAIVEIQKKRQKKR